MIHKKCRDCEAIFWANFDWQVTCPCCSNEIEKAFLPPQPQNTLPATTVTNPIYTKPVQTEWDGWIVDDKTKVENNRVYISTARGCGKSELMRQMLEERLKKGEEIFHFEKVPLPSIDNKKWEEECNELIVRYNEADIAAVANVVKEFREKMGIEPKIRVKKVIFDYPATIVYWYDNTKTVVKCREGEHFDMETGLAMAFCKKLLGDKYKSRFRKIIKGAVIKHTEPEKSSTDALNEALNNVLDDMDKDSGLLS